MNFPQAIIDVSLCLGMSVTMITQYDITRLQAIEEHVGVKMEEFPVDETDALKLLKIVSIVKREVEIRLNENNFGEKRDTNRLKHGMEPKYGKQAKKKIKPEKNEIESTTINLEKKSKQNK